MCFGVVIHESCSGHKGTTSIIGFCIFLTHIKARSSKVLSVLASSQYPLHPPGCLWQKKPLCLKCHMFSSKSEEVFGKFEVHMGMTRSKYKLHLCIIRPSPVICVVLQTHYYHWRKINTRTVKQL